MRQYLFIALLFCTGWKILDAQEPVSRHITATNTYLPTTVFYVFEDSHQFMWMATNSGVYQFNGYDYKHFTSGDGLGDNEILRIYEDKKGRIWFQSVNGNPSYYLHDSIFNNANSAMLKKMAFNKMILTECEDALGNLYIGSREGTYYRIDSHDAVTGFTYTGNENFMWCDANNRVQFLSKMDQPFPRGTVFGQSVYFGQGRILYKVNQENKYVPVLALPDANAEIIFLKAKNENEFYIGTRNGLYIWNRNDSIPLQYILGGLSVSSVAFDFEENLWVSTLESGVYFIPSLDVLEYNAHQGLAEDRVTCIEKDDRGNLWIGMSKNKYAVLNPNGLITNYSFNQENPHDITNIRHFDHITWVASKRNILKIDGAQKKLIDTYGNDLLILPNNKAYVAQENTIVVTRDVFEHNAEKFIDVNWYQRKDILLINARTNVIREDPFGGIWFGTSRGLYYEKGKMIALGESNAVFQSPVKDINFSKDGTRVYVATLNGLLVSENGTCVNILDKTDGLPNSDCNALYVDDADQVWAAFGNELVCIRFSGESTTLENYSDRLKIESARITDIDMIGNRMYLATESGLIYFDLPAAAPFHTAPLLHFTDFMVNNISLLNGGKRTFRYNENDIGIFYSGISFLSGAQITYAYMLEGYDNEWHYSNDRSILFKSLPAGEYRFRISAVGIAGIRSAEAEIPFTILSPVWERAWFWLLVITILSATVILIWRSRLQRLTQAFEQQNRTMILEKEKVEIEHKLSELSQQAFRQQMNPHFIFNALNTIKGYYAENDVKKASDYISKFSRLLRTILENREAIIPLEKEMASLRLYLELSGMRYENIFSYHFEVGTGLLPEETGIPPMLLQPFIENALIHGLAPKKIPGNIEVRFEKKNNSLVCMITDDGIGRRLASGKKHLAEHTSRATDLITEYMAAMNLKHRSHAFTLEIVDLENDKHQPSGTRVILKMPFIKI